MHATRGTSLSGSIVRIAQASIAIGVVAMLLSVSILKGYQDVIEQKVLSFDAHIHVQSYAASDQTEPRPIPKSASMVRELAGVRGVKHIQPYGLKPALLKADGAVQGILIKGYDSVWDTATFGINMVQGRMPRRMTAQQRALLPDSESTDLLISTKIARVLNLKVGDAVVLYFLQNPPRFRKMTVCGLYETSLEEFDTEIVIADLALLANLSNWADTLCSGYEILTHDARKAPDVALALQAKLDYRMQAKPITEIHPQVFDWLQLIARNVEIIITLVVLVACFNMCSTLLILILERTRMIGLLKALGASQQQLSGIFFFTGFRIVSTGILWGNVAALLLGWLQYQFHLIPLEAANYYVAYVPIAWNATGFLLVNLIIVAASSLALWLPGLALMRVNVVRALRFS